MKNIRLVMLFALCWAPVSFAQLDGEALGKLTTAITEMCETPTKTGKKFSASGSVSGGTVLKIFDAGIEANLSLDEWEGIQQYRESQPDRLKCVVKLGTILTPLFANSVQTPRCKDPFSWDKSRAKCMKVVDVPKKQFSIPLDRPIKTVMGSILFRINKERVDYEKPTVQHKRNPGAIQIDIPIMLKKTLVGRSTEVIYKDTDGIICSIDSLPGATGWSKKIGVSYKMLVHDCGSLERGCFASLRADNNKRADVQIGGMRVHVSPDGEC